MVFDSVYEMTNDLKDIRKQHFWSYFDGSQLGPTTKVYQTNTLSLTTNSHRVASSLHNTFSSGSSGQGNWYAYSSDSSGYRGAQQYTASQFSSIPSGATISGVRYSGGSQRYYGAQANPKLVGMSTAPNSHTSVSSFISDVQGSSTVYVADSGFADSTYTGNGGTAVPFTDTFNSTGVTYVANAIANGDDVFFGFQSTDVSGNTGYYGFNLTGTSQSKLEVDYQTQVDTGTLWNLNTSGNSSGTSSMTDEGFTIKGYNSITLNAGNFSNPVPIRQFSNLGSQCVAVVRNEQNSSSGIALVGMGDGVTWSDPTAGKLSHTNSMACEIGGSTHINLQTIGSGTGSARINTSQTNDTDWHTIKLEASSSNGTSCTNVELLLDGNLSATNATANQLPQTKMSPAIESRIHGNNVHVRYCEAYNT